jgi:putative DNA primase/helicase
MSQINGDLGLVQAISGDEGPSLVIQIGEQQEESHALSEFDAVKKQELLERLNQTSDPVTVGLTQLGLWPDAARYLVLELIKELGERARFPVAGGQYTNAFDGVLASVSATEDLSIQAAYFRAAIEAASLFHPMMPDAAAAKIKARFEVVGLRSAHVSAIAKQIRDLGVRGERGSINATAAAAGFLAEARSVRGLRDDQFAMVYYRDEFYLYDCGVWWRVGDKELKANVIAWLQKTNTPGVGGRLGADVITNLEGMTKVDDWSVDMPRVLANRDGFSIDEIYIAFANGMIRFKDLMGGTGPVLYDHDPLWFDTARLAFEFDPAATCPRFEQFLGQVLPVTSANDRRQQVIQAAVANCFVRDSRFEKIVALVGRGRNGKSVLLHLLSRLLGEANVDHTPFEQLTNGQFSMQALVGKLASITMELNHLSRQNEATIKALVSGDRLTVDRKYKSPITFQNRAKLLVGTNELPTFSDPSNAIWRRLIVVPFDVVIAEADVNVNLLQELSEELPGIFNWAMVGLRQLLEGNAFPNCARCTALLNQHRRDSDSVHEFVFECCERVPGSLPVGQDLYDVYRTFCQARGRKEVASTQFGKRLIALGFRKVRAGHQFDGGRPWCFRGLRLGGGAEEVVSRTRARVGANWTNFPYATES